MTIREARTVALRGAAPDGGKRTRVSGALHRSPSARRFVRGAFPLVLLCLLSVIPAGAKGEGGSAPVALLLVSGLAYEDLQTGRPASALRPLTKRGMTALLEPSVAGEPTEAAAYLSVGAGVPVSAPENGGKIITEAGLTRTMAEVAQDVYPFAGREANVVARGYRRRYGEYPPLRSVAVHLGVPALRDNQNDAATAARIGALGDALKRAGLRVAVYGDWRAVSVGMDERGAVYAGTMRPLAPENLAAAIRESDVTLVNAATPRTLRMYVAALKNAPDINLIIAAVAPPFAPGEKPVRWASPGFLIGVGPAFAPHTVPVSLTMHLPGYVSALDIAPTVAALAGAAFDSGVGSSLTTARTITKRDSLASLTTLDRQIRVRDKIGGRARIFALALALSALLSALILAGVKWPRFYAAVRVGLCFVAAIPAALLLTGLVAPTTTGLYFGAVTLFAALAALSGAALARCLPFSPLALLLSLTAALVLFDYVTGQTILYRSALYAASFFDASLDAPQRGLHYLFFGLTAAICGLLLAVTHLLTPARRPLFLLMPSLFILLTLFVLVGVALYVKEFRPVASVAFEGLPALFLALIEWMLCASLPLTMEPNESASR